MTSLAPLVDGFDRAAAEAVADADDRWVGDVLVELVRSSWLVRCPVRGTGCSRACAGSRRGRGAAHGSPDRRKIALLDGELAEGRELLARAIAAGEARGWVHHVIAARLRLEGGDGVAECGGGVDGRLLGLARAALAGAGAGAEPS